MKYFSSTLFVFYTWVFQVNALETCNTHLETMFHPNNSQCFANTFVNIGTCPGTQDSTICTNCQVCMNGLTCNACKKSNPRVLYNTLSCRDAWKQPFLSTSIWNTPIGKNAIFYFASISSGVGNVVGDNQILQVGADNALFIISSSSDPVTELYNQASWDKTIDKCINKTATPYLNFPFPQNFIYNTFGNNCVSVLKPDGQKVIQLLSFYRCTPGSHICAEYKGLTNIFTSDGTYGCHGGSGLSGLGGTLRLGELLPTSPPIQHTLNLQLWAKYYYYKTLTSTGLLNKTSCFTWPAKYCDGYAVTDYGGINPYLKMGSLLAVPLSISKTLVLQTVPAQKILYALTYYGGYITDDTNQPYFTFGIDTDAVDEFQKYYGYTFRAAQRGGNEGAFFKDIRFIYRALSIVINNGPDTIGGGGELLTQRIPLCSTAPTTMPTRLPTMSCKPTIEPTYKPTKRPTIASTNKPSKIPTIAPTNKPTKRPTIERTNKPSKIPTIAPTYKPTMEPTNQPKKIIENQKYKKIV